MNVDALNATCPKFPKTVHDKGWTYGVWYCSTSWQKAVLYGQYPATFLRRALALFPDVRDALHAPSGALVGLPVEDFAGVEPLEKQAAIRQVHVDTPDTAPVSDLPSEMALSS